MTNTQQGRPPLSRAFGAVAGAQPADASAAKALVLPAFEDDLGVGYFLM